MEETEQNICTYYAKVGYLGYIKCVRVTPRYINACNKKEKDADNAK